MSTMRSLKRQSQYGYQWKNGFSIRHPDKLNWYQQFVLSLMATGLGRAFLKLMRRAR